MDASAGATPETKKGFPAPPDWNVELDELEKRVRASAPEMGAVPFKQQVVTVDVLLDFVATMRRLRP